MTLFDRPIGPEAYAVIRFGLGYPGRGAPMSAKGILDRLAGPDRVATAVPVMPFSQTLAIGFELRKARRAGRGTEDATDAAYMAIRKQIDMAFTGTFMADLTRAVETDDPFRERLQRFWTNHFTARFRSIHWRTGAAGYAEEAIRPYMTGQFGELLKAAVTHPFMLVYLDQTDSVGPNSPVGLKTDKGLNENLAREVLELHTLGVGGPYSQDDVTQFAELLTGFRLSFEKGVEFIPRRAEPGAETVLGTLYGDDGKAELADIHAALEDLARHPATAGFICGKLAAYFVADQPDDDLVAQMTAAYRRSNGNLTEVYAAMLEHPAAWRDFGAKVKWPFDYMSSGLRALGLRASDLQAIQSERERKGMLRSLRQMGQNYKAPLAPDGWPDTDAAWISPPGLAARIGWAMAVARRLPRDPYDPRIFVADALGDAASTRLIWAASAAESRAEGVGLVLASAEFNRR